ncbi:MAG: hypothetical protein FJ110_13075 [Deltaproteobacteria bacterium]|nr:hypothetical protein [Deltaproteobacteria bacterium]
MKEWQTFVRRFSDMKEGKRELFIKDLSPGKTKYNTKHVYATVAKSKRTLKNPDTLWIRGESGEKALTPWYLVIEKELEEFIPGRPWEDLLEVMAKREMKKG